MFAIVPKTFLAELFHRPLFRAVWRGARRLPGVGQALHRIAGRILPLGERVWVSVEFQALPAARYWFKVEPRYESGHITGTHEQEVQELLCRVLKPGDCFYDVGAHIGFFSVFSAVIVGLDGHVVAFEADAMNAIALQETLGRNGLSEQIDVVERAVWSSPGTLRLLRAQPGPKSNTGMSRLVGDSRNGTVAVTGIILDDFVKTNRAPNFIKIDVEGAESEVLKGAAHVLREHHPRVLCEIHDSMNADFVHRWLCEHGYTCRWVEPDAEFPRHLFAGLEGP